MRPLDYTFDDPLGLPDGWVNSSLTPVSNIITNLRSMYNYDISRARTQQEIDALTQSQLDAMTQTDIERDIVVRGEYWEVAGTGFVNSYDWLNIPDSIPAGSPEIGATSTDEFSPQYTMRRALRLTATGDAIDADITSSIDDTESVVAGAVNLEDDNLPVLVVFTAGDILLTDMTAANSYIQLSSAEDGGFSDSDYLSAAVDFTTADVYSQTLEAAMSDFTTGAGASFDLSQVRGFTMHIEASAPTAGDKLAIQGVFAAAGASAIIDSLAPAIVETRRSILHFSSTGLYRGEGDENDFTMVDCTFDVFFSTSYEHLPEGGPSHGIIIGVRAPATISVILSWSDENTYFSIADTGSYTYYDYSPTVLDNSVDEYIDTDGGGHHTGVGIDNDVGRYCLRLTLTGSTVEAAVLQSNSRNEVIGSPIMNFSAMAPDIIASSGRVSLFTSLGNGFITAIRSENYGFATLKTVEMPSYTPIDGAQLFAASAPPLNSFTEWSWLYPPEEEVDYNNTPSGLGSAKASVGLLSNPIYVRDWTKTSLDFKVWVDDGSSNVVPEIVMTSLSVDTSGSRPVVHIPLPSVRANQWNDVSIDLTRFANLNPGLWYTLAFEGRGTTFAVDSMAVNQIAVDWGVRADPDQPFRSFGNLVNSGRGAVHLGRERGTSLQLQATALTQDAWVASYRLMPRHAQLGLPLYDESYRS